VQGGVAEFLYDLPTDLPRFGIGDEVQGSFLFGWLGIVEGIDEDIGVEEIGAE